MKITTGPIAQTSYQDAGAPAPATGWQAPSGVTATTNDTEKVTVGWTAPSRPLGAGRTYQVSAVNAAGEGALSASAGGRRAGPALTGFEVEAAPSGGSASWFATGTTTPGFVHNDPPRATISGGTIAVTKGDHRAHVRLTTSGGTVGQAPSVVYRVRGTLTGGGVTLTSATATGRRATGALSRQWQRSSGTSASGFSNLGGATGTAHNDTGASSSGAKRWYQLVLSAPGATAKTVGPAEGWRLAFVQVAGGEGHTCAVTNDGQVWCWGLGSTGQLGRGVFEDATPKTPARVPGLTGVVEVYGGRNKSCARNESGAVWCWGGAALGNGQQAASATPTQIVGFSGAAGVALAESHGCATLSGGQARCWDTGGCRAGDGNCDVRLSPVAVRTSASNVLSQATQVSAAWAHTCARLTTGAVWCWGLNDGGKVGSGVGCHLELDCLYAVPSGITAGASHAVAGGDHSCALLTSGAVRCWGQNYWSQLGATGQGGPEPVTVGGISTAVEISATWRSTCVRLANGGVRCWGYNETGELGHGSTVAHSSTPVAPTIGNPILGVASMGSGDGHHCAVQSGDVYCWGSNWARQLGEDTAGDFSNVPLKVGLP